MKDLIIAALTTRVPLSMVLRRSPGNVGHSCTLTYVRADTGQTVKEEIEEAEMAKLDEKIRHGKITSSFSNCQKTKPPEFLRFI